MKKILLVDDEILIRESIRDCIHWEENGYLLCGEAPDGEMALPLIEVHRPDILITDIKMPFMDGLELSRIVKERTPSIKIIILTGHDEFEYARSALRIGVEEFCVKPVGSVELLKILQHVSNQIDAERKQLDQLQQMREIADSHTSMQRDRLLHDLCNGLLSTADAIHQAALLGLRLTSQYYAVAITDYRSEQVSAGPLLLEDTDQIEKHLARLFHTSLLQYFRRTRSETVWILCGNTEEEVTSALSKVEKNIAQLGTILSCRIFLGIGSLEHRLHGLHASFLAADEEKTFRRLIQLNRNELEKNRSTKHHSILVDRNRFFEFLKIGVPAQVPSFVHSFAAGMKDLDWSYGLYGFYLLNDLTLEGIHTIHEIVKNQNSTEEIFMQHQSQIRLVHSWSEACRYLTSLMQQLISLRNESIGKYTTVLDQVKDFIHKNYHLDKLSLQDAANHVCLSPNHLSKIFSQSTGTTFIEYLTQTRIRSAMELLMTTNARTYEVAYQVGYNDPHYFSNLFKKMTGMTTKEFRKSGEGSGTAKFQERTSPHATA